ncbi:MAG: hypothetical protein V5A60_14365 [Haloarculaceae archaeon]
MRCQGCGQVSDWVGDGGDWTRVSDTAASARPLLECTECGHTQRAR